MMDRMSSPTAVVVVVAEEVEVEEAEAEGARGSTTISCLGSSAPDSPVVMEAQNRTVPRGETIMRPGSREGPKGTREATEMGGVMSDEEAEEGRGSMGKM